MPSVIESFILPFAFSFFLFFHFSIFKVSVSFSGPPASLSSLLSSRAFNYCLHPRVLLFFLSLSAASDLHRICFSFCLFIQLSAILIIFFLVVFSIPLFTVFFIFFSQVPANEFCELCNEIYFQECISKIVMLKSQRHKK